MRRFGLLSVFAVALLPAVPHAQGQQADTLAGVGLRVSPDARLRVPRTLPVTFRPLARSSRAQIPPAVFAANAADAAEARIAARERAMWIESVRSARLLLINPGEAIALPGEMPPDLRVEPDTGIAAILADLLGDQVGLGLNAQGRFEAKIDRSRNERCTASQLFVLASQCEAGFQPAFDFQFNVQTRGSIASRIFVNVDYDSQREFDASNNISVFYQGKSDELLERLEVGNVSLQLPPSQFITGGIPAGNYGIQAIGQLGPAKFRTIVAQQRGNVSGTNTFMVGERTLRTEDRVIEDYQVEARRFFFTVDPLLLGGEFPNIDLLNGVQMRAIAEALPDTVRPRKLSVYRLLIGGQPPNPNGPRFALIGDSTGRTGQVYELLRENVDYYTDPSLLWIALARPLQLQNERLVLAYTLRVNGRDTVIASQGGTPDVTYIATRPQLAHLLWDPQTRPGDAAFRREIRSVYRVAGEDLRRSTVSVRILTGGGAGQEKPLAGTDETYLQMFGLAQLGNAALFDTENRLWPRPGDPNVAIGGAANAKIIRDYFLVFPSVRPFARDGLVDAGNPASDTVYTTPSEDIYSQQHPPSQYRIRLRFDVEGGGDVGNLALGAVQLRPNSEVIVIEGTPLVRDEDYTIDYEIGFVTFTRPDTLFPRPRQVTVRYEENPLFASAPTSILGVASQIPLERGELGFVAISQRQRTSFTRPPLGYEPQSSLIAGVNGRFSFDAPGLSRLIERIPTVNSTSLSRIDVQGEFATSRPQPNTAGQAYVESFEGEGGVGVPLVEAAWYYSSQPSLGGVLPQRFGAETFSLLRATTMAWQNSGLNLAGFPVNFTIGQIDPQVNLTGNQFSAPEPMLWLTMYPLGIGGLYNDDKKDYQWRVTDAPMGKRWRSVVASLGASGSDLSRIEYITFWTLADTSVARRTTNPSLVIDLGDVSENSAVFGPTQLTVTPTAAGVNDSVFTGKAFMGLDELDTERDSISRSFNQATNDVGLPGDVVPSMLISTPNGLDLINNFPTCSGGAFRLLLLGDSRANCTIGNGRLDEEDVDRDNVLNFTEAQRDQERVRRYVVNLADPTQYNRVGRCSVAAFDTTGGGTVTQTDLCWVQVRIPFRAPDDSLNGGPNVRRVKMVRLTMVSGDGLSDTSFSTMPLARFRFEGAPWIKRADRSVRGIAGDELGTGFVIASVIGTLDRDTLRMIDYEPPPGVVEAAEREQTGLENTQQQINERSLRILAGGLETYDRAEAYLRFPEGAKNFMNYREMRLWARGRGNGWGVNGELQFFVKIGRDQNNFYLYRTPVNAGPGRTTWLPEVRVEFDKLFALRERLTNAFFGTLPDSIACTGADSILIARSGIPIGQPINRHAACADGYIVYTVDPAVNPPDLAHVQELAVGIVRLEPTTGLPTIFPTDTLEVWVDDIRLTDVERTPGYAGVVSANVTAGDVANVRVSLTRRDGNFRQLAEQPTFVATDGFAIGTNIRLERMLPGMSSYSLPLTINHTAGGSEPTFLSQSDVRASGIAGLRTPRNASTSYSINVRRTRPMTGSPLAVVLNNLGANASIARANTRSEFSEGRNSTWNVGLDYNLLANPRIARLPSWLSAIIPGSDSAGARFRWNPTNVRFSSQMGHTNDRRTSYLKPAAVASDTGRRVNGLTHIWRTAAAVEFRPVTSLSARLDLNSVRDLRDYGDTTATAIIASGERDKFLGADLGLERERQMSGLLTYSPPVTSWFRPSVTLSSTYTMQRDAQSRQLVRTEDSTGAFRLPRRLSNSQIISASSLIDPGRALRLWRGDSGWVGRIGGALQQFDLQYSRTLNSAYDGAPFTPGLGYQFGAGGIDDFRFENGRPATLAGATEAVSFNTGVRLPFGVDVSSAAQRGRSDNFTFRVDDTQVVNGTQATFPDVQFRWTFNPSRNTRIISGVTASFRYRETQQTTVIPSDREDALDDRRVNSTLSRPLSLSLRWGASGALQTVFNVTRETRTDSVPGSISETEVQRYTAEVNRPFRLPASWNVRTPLQARVSWEQDQQSTFVFVAGSEDRSRLADNGRTAVNFSINTGVAQNLNFNLQASRVVSYDNNFDRRFSQFVLTTAFTLVFGAGNLQ